MPANVETSVIRKRGAAMESLTDCSSVVNFIATSGLTDRTVSRTVPISDSGGTPLRITTWTSLAA